MEIILSNNVTSLRGKFGGDYGYSIRRRGNRFFSCRYSKGRIPRYGHLHFIFLGAKMSLNGLYIADVRVLGSELLTAATEAGHPLTSVLPDVTYNAHDILNIKQNHRL